MPFDVYVQLVEEDRGILEQALSAPILVLDDVHFKGDKKRGEGMQDLLEARYNANRTATFMTSNLSPEDLVKSGNEDPVLRARLLSRLKEMFVFFNFDDA